MPTLRKRTAALAVLLTALSIVLLPATAFANTFGTRYQNASTYYGSRVSITTPNPTSTSLKSTDFVLGRAVVQSGFPSNLNNAGLAQVGVYMAGPSIQLDNCGHNNRHVYVYYEYHPINSGASGYICGINQEVTPGTTYRYSTFVSNNWKFFFAGGEIGSASLNGMHTGYPMIGSEMASSNGTYLTYTKIIYGGNTSIPWDIFRGSGATSPVEVTNNSQTRLAAPSTGWSVGAVPTPLSVTHGG